MTDGVRTGCPSTAEPDVRMDIAVLGSIYLGAIAPSAMAAAGNCGRPVRTSPQHWIGRGPPIGHRSRAPTSDLIGRGSDRPVV